MTVLVPQSLRSFDEQARGEIRSLVETNRVREALERLAQYEAQGREELILYYGLRARAYRQLDDFAASIADWVRALHLTSRSRALRPRVRICLADTLAFSQDFVRAERMIQRCVAEIRSWGGDPLEPWALSSLAYLHLTRGHLSLAVRLYENAQSLLGEDSDLTMRVAIVVNYSHALTRWGEFERARAAQAKVASLVDQGLKDVAPLFLSQSLLAIDSGDLDGAEEALARASDQVVGDDQRLRRIQIQLAARIAVARERFHDALAIIDEAERPGPYGPSLLADNSELLRLRALALLGLGRAEDALDAATRALQFSSTVDSLDRPAILRVLGRCLAAVGRVGEARERLATALSLLESTELVVERRALHEDMATLGMPVPLSHPTSPAIESRHTVRPEVEVHRFELEDGRSFLTTDRDLVTRIHLAAQSRLPVLLEGETGTGKELVARLLHQMSSARLGPFVVVDCTTLNETLAEAELFGAARGAYTGAASDREGLIGLADGGSVLFDELPELSLSAQSKLLRLLQEGTYRRLGEARPRQVKVRVIAATNQDTERLLSQGALKADLFFRLHGYRIRLRPLRERPDDVALLAQHFAVTNGLAGVTLEALAELTACAWPGNARQLEMMIRVAASSLGRGRWLERDTVTRMLAEAPKLSTGSSEGQRLKRALDSNAGNVAATARALGMSRQGLYKALHRNGLI
jgi:anaerobic nitric oxide reductase transcription regulator